MAHKPLTKILYVEDEPDIQTVALMALETIGGFTVRACSSGQEALEAAPEFEPDLVILDVMMPGMDGPATMQALRKLPAMANVDMIFMTAKVQSQEIERYLEMGAVDVIAKPFDPMALATQVQAASFRVSLKPDQATDALQSRIETLMAQPELICERRGKTADLRPQLVDLTLRTESTPPAISISLLPNTSGAIPRPDDILTALQLDPLAHRIERTELVL